MKIKLKSAARVALLVFGALVFTATARSDDAASTPVLPRPNRGRVLFAQFFSPLVGHASNPAFEDADLRFQFNSKTPSVPFGAAYKSFELDGKTVAGCPYGVFYHGSVSDGTRLTDAIMKTLEKTNDVSQIASGVAGLEIYQQNPRWVARDSKGEIAWHCDGDGPPDWEIPFDFTSCAAIPGATPPFAADHMLEQCLTGAMIEHGHPGLEPDGAPYYSAISLDNVTLEDSAERNPFDGGLDFSETTATPDGRGPIIQPFGGDPAKLPAAALECAQKRVAYMTWLTNKFHEDGLAVAFNLHLGAMIKKPTTPLAALEQQMIKTCDIWVDEDGFNNAGQALVSLDSWQKKMSAVAAKCNGHDPNAYVCNNYTRPIGGSFAQASADATQMGWILANFLLVKGERSYLSVKGTADDVKNPLDYGNMFSPPVGEASALPASVPGTNLYARSYGEGIVVVNPDPAASWSFTVPAPTAGHHYAKWISESAEGTTASVPSVVTLAPQTGLVLVLEPN